MFTLPKKDWVFLIICNAPFGPMTLSVSLLQHIFKIGNIWLVLFLGYIRNIAEVVSQAWQDNWWAYLLRRRCCLVLELMIYIIRNRQTQCYGICRSRESSFELSLSTNFPGNWVTRVFYVLNFAKQYPWNLSCGNQNIQNQIINIFQARKWIGVS